MREELGFGEERLMHSMGRVPTFGVIGASFWIAWITIIYSTDAFFPADIDPRQATSGAFVISTLSLGVTLIALSFFPQWTMRRLLGERPLSWASCIGAAATLVVLNGPMLPTPLFFAAAVLTGCVTALIALRVAIAFSEVDTRAALVGMGCALMLGVLVYALDTMLLLCELRSLAVVVLVLLLPLAAFLLSLDVSEGTSLALTDADRSLEYPRISTKLARLIAYIVMLLFLLSLTRGYYPNLIELSQFATSRCLVGLGLIAAAMAIVVMAWIAPRHTVFGVLFYGILLGSVLTVLVLALLNVTPVIMGDVSSVLFGVTLLCLWGLLCRVSFRSGRLAVQVIGIGFGAACLGATAGMGAGSLLYAIEVSPRSFSLIMAASIILCVVASKLLLRLDDVCELMQPAVSDLDVDDVANSAPVASAMDSPTPALSAPATYKLTPALPTEIPIPSTLGGYQASLRRLCAVLAVDHGLSQREADVLELLALSKDTKAIADELFISFNTVRSHVRRIYVKLDVHSRRELMEFIEREGGTGGECTHS
ncbi:response regulator transcription factor [Adlercreutzia sp. ZJ138]|uniref:response regulator transcription factor n=1 Tax=Adlercreutzia sp. ZJ138 TaxID=2709405 RepID=UPI0013EB7136|nr:LuxR family transcriptional regulator [Adlercreutzia sp. ZJ138]